MLVLNTTSPKISPPAPKAVPVKMVPSASASFAGEDMAFLLAEGASDEKRRTKRAATLIQDRLVVVICREARARLLFVRDDELVEANHAFSRFAHAVKQLFHQAAEPRLANGIVVMLPVAAGLDQTGDAEQGEVMADSRLALAEPIAESRHV